MSSAPPRRFNVEPVETTAKSSKNSTIASAEDSKPRRRFAPTPIETTAKSSRKNAPESIEITQRKRFVPEPVETTTRTSRGGVAKSPLKSPGGSRDKFAQEWETQICGEAAKSPLKSPGASRHKFAQEWESQICSEAGKSPLKSPGASRDKFAQEWQSQGTRKFKPEPVESTSSTNRKNIPKASDKRPARRFAPLLIETAKRSRRSGDSAPALTASDKTEATSGDDRSVPRGNRRQVVPPPPKNTPTVNVSQNPLFLEIQRATSPGAMRRPSSFSSMRSHHSFRVPDLDPIESSESEGSNPPSPTTSPSNLSDHSYMYTEATRMRESVDARFSGYLLELAAKAAEKQLQEQAMAAFPNDDHHEPVEHYVDHESDSAGSYTEEIKQRRDSSFTEVNWELVAMRQHREKIEQQQRNEREAAKKRAAEMNKPEPPKPSPWGKVAALPDSKDVELDRMRKGARPPMLGKDIDFPRCQSPEPARFDTTQGCDAVRIAMCYLSEQSHQAEKGEGLWCGGSNKSNTSARPSLYSLPSRPPSRNDNGNGNSNGGGGLWGGCCVNSGLTPPRGPTGILTPSIEISNPFSPCPTPQASLLPPTPPASHADFACIDEKLATEAAIDEDFGDDFVTQVYNYLSLGYPSIARNFDQELSKISKISVAELRQDDDLATSRGYIRLGEDGNLADAKITEETCMRWRALRVYIREWARQHPNMANENAGAGIAVRKGSWAV